jgi:hypothetical protein
MSMEDDGSLVFAAGVEQGKIEGYWHGRQDAWNALLVCLGMSLQDPFTCDVALVETYLRALECFLKVEKLSYPTLDALTIVINQANTNLELCGLKPKIQEIIDKHWVTATPPPA